jgi:hypothetical protein
MFALSVFAVPAAAAHDPKDPDHGDGEVFVHVTGLIDENFPDSVFDGDELFPGDQFSPGDKVIVTDSENMDKHAKKGVMPGDNVQFPDTIIDDKIVPGGGVAYDVPPEDQFLKAKKAFDEHVPHTNFEGDGDTQFPGREWAPGGDIQPDPWDGISDGDGDQVEEGPELQG